MSRRPENPIADPHCEIEDANTSASADPADPTVLFPRPGTRSVAQAIEDAASQVFERIEGPGDLGTHEKRRALSAQIAEGSLQRLALDHGCPVHQGLLHGGEAEELRSGIEKILAESDLDPIDLRASLQALLDDVDARDSLAHLERGNSTKTRDARMRLAHLERK